MKKLTTCLWFDTQAEDAATLYASVFKGKVGAITRYTAEGQEFHRKTPGSVMTVELEILGQTFVALNGGTQFTFNESISFQVPCDTQAEIDYYWNALTAGGGKEGHCGWLTDRFGVSWQITSTVLTRMLKDKDSAKVQRVLHAMFKMKKLEIAVFEKAFAG